jgi:hypothetical protein
LSQCDPLSLLHVGLPPQHVAEAVIVSEELDLSTSSART